MKVSIEICPDVPSPYAVIYTNEMSKDVEHIVSLLRENDTPIIAQQDERLNVLKPDEIYMVRIEKSKTVIYGQVLQFTSKKRLYELKEQLGGKFMQISKAVLINLAYLDHVEPGFGGALFITLKDGLKEYVSRTYLSDFKHYLGL